MRTGRPLTGILFFNMNKSNVKRGLTKSCFRPLTRILFFNPNNGLYDKADPNLKFPSPYGDFFFNISQRVDPSTARLCFRPLTGILFFNLSARWKVSRTSSRLFPSPYGDFVFQHEKED